MTRLAKMKTQSGFTLIELMITVVVIAILASLAYPSYTNYIERSNLAEAKSALMEAASQMERYYTSNYEYAVIDLDVDLTEKNPYSVSNPSISTSGGGFLISATGSGRVPDDCGTIWVDSLGQRGSGTAPSPGDEVDPPDPGECW